MNMASRVVTDRSDVAVRGQDYEIRLSMWHRGYLAVLCVSMTHMECFGKLYSIFDTSMFWTPSRIQAQGDEKRGKIHVVF